MKTKSANAKLQGMLKELPKLSKAEVATLQKAIAFLHDAPNPVELSPFEDLVYSSLMTTLGKRVPYRQFVESAHGKAYKRDISFTEQFFEPLLRGTPRVVNNAFMRNVWRLAAEDLQRRNIPVGINSMAYSVSRLPDIFNAAFPGYVDSGAVNLIFKSLKKGK
jgi:hypothetical protein